MQMNFVERVDLQRWLLVLLVTSCCWFGLSILTQLALLMRGSNRTIRLIPSFLRVSLVSMAALMSTPRMAAAQPAGLGPSSLPVGDGNEGNWMPIALTSSAATNALAASAYVRRKLVRMRTERFASEQHEDTEEAQLLTVLRPECEESDWDVVVRVLGPPVVETRDGRRITFGKGKAQELLIWMTEHRHVSTRSGARTALWEGAIQDATFSNVVSEVRRALNAAVPLDSEEWIPRTFTDELLLHRGVVTDAEILDKALHRFLKDPLDSLVDLKNALAASGNLPFSGANYVWADAEGITTSHVMKVVKAAVLLGEYAIQNDDTDLLFTTTDSGLRVLPGHEELVALRMRGHSRVGNRSAIKQEWESYARAVEADSWAGAVPSAALENLAHELSRTC